MTSMPKIQTCGPQKSEETSAASFGEKLLLQKKDRQELFHCQNGARNPINQFNVEVTNMLPTIGA